MATEDYRHQVVRDDDEESAPGSWEVVVHDCQTPGKGEIESRKATVNSIWVCGQCEDRWKLINHTKHGTFASLENKQTLVWRRITPKDED